MTFGRDWKRWWKDCGARRWAKSQHGSPGTHPPRGSRWTTVRRTECITRPSGRSIDVKCRETLFTPSPRLASMWGSQPRGGNPLSWQSPARCCGGVPDGLPRRNRHRRHLRRVIRICGTSCRASSATALDRATFPNSDSGRRSSAGRCPNVGEGRFRQRDGRNESASD